MPETAESVPRVDQFFVGVVDLFAIILPGAIMTYWMLRVFSVDALDKPLQARQWVMFFIASYVVGHVISGTGGFLLDKVYDRTYKLSDAKGRKEYIRLRLRAKSVAKQILKRYYADGDNALSWAEAFVQLSNSSASAQIEHLEADSKFFRSLAVVVVVGWPIYSVLPNWRSPPCHGWLGAASLLPVLAYFLGIWARRGLSDDLKEAKQAKLMATTDGLRAGIVPLEAEVTAEWEANYEVSQPLRKWGARALSAWAALVAIPRLVCGALSPPQSLTGLGCAALGVFAVLRYMEKRLKRTELTYRFAIATASNQPSSGGDAGGSHRIK